MNHLVIRCFIGQEGKGNGTPAISGKSRLVKNYLGGGFIFFLNFHPENWGNDPI